MLATIIWFIRPIRHPFVKTYNFETIGGLEVIYDLTEPWGNKVKKAKYMGSELHSRQNYWVSLTSYRASGAGGFTMLKNQPIEFYSPQLLRDYFEKYLSEKGTITPRKRNWHFDRKLLCGIHDSKKLERHGSFNNLDNFPNYAFPVLRVEEIDKLIKTRIDKSTFKVAMNKNLSDKDRSTFNNRGY